MMLLVFITLGLVLTLLVNKYRQSLSYRREQEAREWFAELRGEIENAEEIDDLLEARVEAKKHGQKYCYNIGDQLALDRLLKRIDTRIQYLSQ